MFALYRGMNNDITPRNGVPLGGGQHEIAAVDSGDVQIDEH